MEDTDWRPTPCPKCGTMRPAARHPVCWACGPQDAAPSSAGLASYDLETLRAIAANRSYSGLHTDRERTRAWSQYHHALQAMYERGELVVVGKGVSPTAAPEVLFTDGAEVVMLGRVPDQFVRYRRDDRRFPETLTEQAVEGALSKINSLPTEVSQDWPHDLMVSRDQVTEILKSIGAKT